MRFELRGLEEMKAKLQKIAQEMPTRVAAALYVEAEIEVTECKRRTPVDTGTLRASIHQEGPTYNGRTISTAITAGGAAEQYALIVHEDLEAHHPVGEAKYIERPLKESLPHMANRIGARLKL